MTVEMRKLQSEVTEMKHTVGDIKSSIAGLSNRITATNKNDP